MKYFYLLENPLHPFQLFQHEPYEIPLLDIILIKKHLTESVKCALYIEEGIVYLLTGVSIKDNCIFGYGSNSRPYCKLEEFNNFTLDVLDRDAYNWYMTQAR